MFNAAGELCCSASNCYVSTYGMQKESNKEVVGSKKKRVKERMNVN